MRQTVLVFVIALSVAACGGEQISEQILEESLGGDANVDIGDDGEVSINVESDEGSISIGSGSEVPEQITLPYPGGGTVMSSFAVDEQASVSINYPNDRFEEIEAFYDDMVANSSEGGWQVTEQTLQQPDGVTMRTRSWYSTEGVRQVSMRDCYSFDSDFEGPFDQVCVDILEADDV